jgi:hypothetical protein
MKDHQDYVLLTGVARQFAAEALAHAIAHGGDPSEIAAAQQSLEAGDVLRQSAAFKEAVGKYRDGLAKAESALL